MTVLPDDVPWRWCFSTLGCPNYTLEQAAMLASRFGVSSIELRVLAGEINLPRYFASAMNNDPMRIGAILDRHRVGIVALDSSWRLLEADSPARQEALALARWAELLRVPHLRVFDGGEAGAFSDRRRREMLRALQWWREERFRHGWKVELIVETHWALTAAEACRKLRQSYSKIRLLWDSHHTWRAGGGDPQRFWKKFRPVIRHIHIKDSVTDNSAAAGFRNVLPGTGEFPLRQLLQVLRADGFAGTVSLEWERYWLPGLPPLEEALEHLASATLHG